MQRIIFSLVLVLFLFHSAYAEDGKRDITSFLLSNYGFTFEPSFFQKSSWECPEKRMVKPSGNVTHNWVCERKDPSLKRVISWRASDDAIETLKQGDFNVMAGGKAAPRGEPVCKESPYSVADGKVQGTIQDCTLPLPNGEFYISFFHFSYRNLGFTLVSRNASPKGSTPNVADDLRKWLTELRFSD